MSEKNCSPLTEDNTITCFEDESLIKIAKKYNKQYPNDKIEIIYDKNNVLDRKSTWGQIKSKMMRFTPQCKEDWCLLQNNVLSSLKDKKIHEDTFRPKIPEEWNGDLTEWLSTLDIQAVMEQYELKYTDFKFIGPVPIDFDNDIFEGMCVSDELCKINLTKLYKQGVRKLGIVFNLDPHYRGGSHWVCMFVDFKTGGIYFFDSVGMPPPKEIKDLMDKLKNQGNNLIMKNILNVDDMDDTHTEIFNFIRINKDNTIKVQKGGAHPRWYAKLLDNIAVFKGNILNRIVDVGKDGELVLDKQVTNQHGGSFKTKCFKEFYNKKQFQYKDSECGIYAIHFLEEFLKGKKFNEIVTNKHTDAQMFELRKKYFRKN